MKGILKKEVRPITFDKIIIELEARERDILLGFLDRDDNRDLEDEEIAVLSVLKKALSEPELVKEPVVTKTKTEVPKMKTDDLDPTDPKFKSKVLERLMKTYLLPNVKTVDQWKASALNFVLKSRKDITSKPVSMNDEDFFAWLVEANFIDRTGSPVDQTAISKQGPVTK